MKSAILFCCLFFYQTCFAQFKITVLGKNSIPKSFQYKGKIVKAVNWSDTTGEHIVITTETGEIQNENLEGDYRDAALYGYHYLKQGNIWRLTWKVQDFIKECPVDIKANYIKNTFSVTDLNKNGKAEVWLMYKTVCHGDVSPSNMKIIMYENNKKYAVRGTSRVKVSDNQYEGGEYTFDESFKQGSEIFRNYALQLWKKNLIENFN